MVMLRKDARSFANVTRMGCQQSKFKQLFIACFAAGLIAGLWRLFLDGFRFISALGGMGTLLIQRLFGLFFFSLAAMLLMSSMITAYAVVFRGRENQFLILSPLPPGQRILHQWLEITLISAWAFFFMIVPFIGAFVMHENLSWFFVVWTGLLSVPFVLLCCGIGTLLALLLTRCLPRIRPGWVALALAITVGAWWWRSSAAVPPRADEALFLLARLAPGLALAAFPLWPSHWITEGILCLSRGDWLRGVGFVSVLLSNLLMIGLLVEKAGQAWFFSAWQRVLDAGAVRARKRVAENNLVPSGGYSASWLEKLLLFLPRDCRALMLKDWRQMWRDPVQWTQGAVFFGLLAVYFLNLRNLNYHTLTPIWRNLVAFINIFSLAAIMCSFCSRFVYPQMSLEGHSCWILGLAPPSMGRVLMVKLASSTVVLLFISVGLLMLSSGLLNVTAGVRWTAILIAAAMAPALCALAVGLGSIFLDLRQTNPTIIISGFGGTLNLALSLAYMIAAVLPFAAVFHWYFSGRVSEIYLRYGVGASAIWLVLLTALTVVVPMLLARRSLMRREY